MGITILKDTVTPTLRRLSQAFPDIQRRASRVLAEAIVADVQDSIYAGRVGGPPLLEATVRRKGSATKLLDTGAYVDSFQVRPVGGYWTVVCDERLLNIHEFGLGAPARPHLMPALGRVKQAAPQLIQGLIRASLSQR